MNSTKDSSPVSVLVIGAGLCGIACGIALKRRLEIDDFIVIEQADDVGGVWRDNIYPGCASDVPVHLYSLSTDLNPNWSHTLCRQDEIHEYCRQIPEKHNLQPHMIFNRQVVHAEWKADQSRWQVTTKDLKSGNIHNYRAKIVISAAGSHGLPLIPDFDGLEAYKGISFHSGRWRKDVSLKGKRVAVIGNAASGTQLVPMLAEEPTTQITQFCRTPGWLAPPSRVEYAGWLKWMLRNFLPLLLLWRFSLFIKHEMVNWLIFNSKFGRQVSLEDFKKYLRSTAPPQYIEKLTPDHNFACRRLTFDSGYFSALHKPNLTPCWDGIARFVEEGIVTNKGETLPFDVVIFATGYMTNRYEIPFIGSQGNTIQQYYDAQGGGKAYRGLAVPGFPNFFMIGGPNTSTGHTSYLYCSEIQIGYIMQLIKPILNNVAPSMEVTTAATDAYNDIVQHAMKDTVFVTCRSWYRSGGDGRVTFLLPISGFTYWVWLRRPHWDAFSVPPNAKEAWANFIRSERQVGILRDVGYLAVVIACTSILLSRKFW